MTVYQSGQTVTIRVDNSDLSADANEALQTANAALVLANDAEGKANAAFSRPPTFVQATAPIYTAPYTWWDTSGGDITLWIEDGT